MKSFKVLFVMLGLVCGLRAVGTPVLPDPRTTLEAFCKAEFEGSDNAFWIKTISNAKMAEFSKRNHGERISPGELISVPYFCSPIAVIRSFRIVELRVTGQRAIGIIEYEVCGKIERSDENECANTITIFGNKIIRESLKLVFADGKNSMGGKDDRGRTWYIEDPPFPKVSVETILRLCKKQQEDFQNIAKTLQARGRPVPPNITLGINTFERKVKALESLDLQPSK